MRLIVLCALCLSLAACGRVPVPRISFLNVDRPAEPLPYPTRLLADRGSDRFGVAVAAPGVPLDAVRESVRFEGTRHCLSDFGSSSIVWDAQGEASNWVAQTTASGERIFSGRCVGR